MLVATGCTNRHSALVKEAPLLARTLTDDTAQQHTFKASPKRIICLAPHLAEIVYAIGASGRLIAVGEGASYPEQSAALQRIALRPALDVQAIIALKPDCVLLWDQLLPQAAVRKALAAEGIPVVAMHVDSLAHAWRGIRKLGVLLEAEPRANALADSLQEFVTKLRAITVNRVQYSAAMLFGTTPARAVARGHVSEMLQTAGARNVFATGAEPYPMLNADSLLYKNPEYLLVLEADGQYFSNYVSQYPGLVYTTALVQNQVFQLTPDLYFHPGPRLGQGLVELVRALHPEIDLTSLTVN